MRIAMSLEPTFHGFVETTTDTLLLFEACRQGILPKVTRRLQDRERKDLVVSGTVFIFDERESGMHICFWSPPSLFYSTHIWLTNRIFSPAFRYQTMDRWSIMEPFKNIRQLSSLPRD